MKAAFAISTRWLVLCCCLQTLTPSVSWPTTTALASVFAPGAPARGAHSAGNRQFSACSMSTHTSAAQTETPSGLNGAIGRPFRMAADRSSLDALCTESWDYLLSTIDYFDKSPEDYPFVLEAETEGTIVAFGNLHMIDSRTGWVQAIRSHPASRGRGFGTKMSQLLAEECSAMGGTQVLSSTHPSNKVMQKIFAKLDWKQVAEYGFWPLEPHRKSFEDCKTGTEFLTRTGLGHFNDNEAVSKFRPCQSVREASDVLQAFTKEATAAWGVELSPSWIPEIFRVHGPSVLERAVEEGRVWVKEEGGAAVVVKLWSVEDEVWVFSISSADAASFQAAVGLAAQHKDGVFIVCHSNFGEAFRRDCLGDAAEHGVAWPLYAKDIAPPSST